MPQPRPLPSDSRLNLLGQPEIHPIKLAVSTARRLEDLIWKLSQPKDAGSVPGVPQSVTAYIQPNGTVRIAWKPTQDADISHYNIYRADDTLASDSSNIHNIGHKSPSQGATDRKLYFDWATPKDPSAYYFAVEAVDEEELSSGYSEWVTPTTDPDSDGTASGTYDCGGGYAGSFSTTISQYIGLVNGATWNKYFVTMTGSASWTMVLNGVTIASGSGSASGTFSPAKTFVASSTFQFNITSGSGSNLYFGCGF